VKDGIQQVDEKSFRFVNEFFDEALKGSIENEGKKS
jgi:hypothetical protein